MGSFNNCKKYFIGHSKLDGLFELSLLAHEIGHTTVYKERDLKKAFCETSINEENFEFEMESYLYEKVFAQNVYSILNELGVTIEGENAEELLYKMRKVKYNKHLLQLKLATLFFEGVSLSEISCFYKENSNDFGIEKENLLNNGLWVKSAKLDNPLFCLPYLLAFEKSFSFLCEP